MPTYVYTSDCGKYEERYFKMGEAPKSITSDDGVVLLRDFGAEHSPKNAGSGWPIECVASGVNAAQAGELREFFKSHGCPTEVTNDGNPVYRSHQHQREALKLRGMINKSNYC